MNLREGVLWGHRLFLNRDPESDSALADFADAVRDADGIRTRLAASEKYATLLDRAGHVFEPRYPSDWREGVLWSYRLLLGREPAEDEVRHHLVDGDSLGALRRRFALSLEFRANAPELTLLSDFAVINAFAPFPALTPIPGAMQDFLGSITQVDWFPSHWWQDGHVQKSVPRESEPSLHGTSEWVGTLRSILEAGESLTVVELGAGWGPWLVVAERAARMRGIERIRLIGVEGSAEHFGFMLDNFRLNGIDPEQHALHRAVVGEADGVAAFPQLHDAAADYGAKAVFDEAEREEAARRGALGDVRSISLDTLLRDVARADLIHIDIQGHEEAVIRAAIDVLDAKARRLVIGTHSRTIEGHLFDLLQAHGWTCESEVPCRLRTGPDGALMLDNDGEQVWRNDRV